MYGGSILVIDTIAGTAYYHDEITYNAGVYGIVTSMQLESNARNFPWF
jgi:hypothetical protein